jgi:hypothetical protein
MRKNILIVEEKNMIKLTAKFYKENDTRARRVWPTYSTQILNIAGQNSRCFDAKKVGSMKESWLEFVKTGQPDTLENWENFQRAKIGEESLQWSADKLFDMVHNKMQILWITKEMCRDYIEEVIFNKTHFGMGGESAAIQAASKYFNLPFRFSNAEEESQGIDGWIGEYPVQVKPEDTYKKGHVFNAADTEKTLVLTYEKKKFACYIHNPEFISC